MSLKNYQERIVREVHEYFRALAAARTEGLGRYASAEAWKRRGVRGRYTPEENGLGEDMPRVCVKTPTGGGKTLLATQMLGSALQTILTERNGTGLALWIVPSGQIFRDTLKALRERGGFLRTMLEHAVSRKVEVWEKTDIVRLTPAQSRECLNILVVQLASTNRETKEQLKFFKDSGGNITLHFPPEDDAAAHRALKERFPNLETIEDDAERGRCLVKTSVGNFVKMCRPPVVLDEGHKATSELAQRTIREFNASVVMELSATPKAGANVLARATGQELLDEHMIKLPLNIAVSGARDWKDVLTKARDRRESLAKAAAKLVKTGDWDRLIRPIVLVQVERTGKDQRGGKHIHAEDVREHLIQRLGVPALAIAVKSSETDDIEGIDLMDDGCPTCWIITKSALQEGWDCPFAYILASLDNTGSERAMTQLIGRVLRQPFQERTPNESLNQSYVYCLRATAEQVAQQVKKALEREGYEGDMQGAVVVDEGDRATSNVKTARMRKDFAAMYKAPFEGKVYLPRFCVRDGKYYVALDYFEHLLGRVDVRAFEYGAISWNFEQALAEARDRFYVVTLGDTLKPEGDRAAELLESDDQVRAWLLAGLPFDYLSFKQLRIVVRNVCDRVTEVRPDLRGRLALIKFELRQRIEDFIRDQVDRQTEAAFKALFDDGRVCFYLECAECRFEIPPSIEVKSMRRLTHDDGDQIKKSLFDYVDDESHNEYERAVALCLDRQASVLWWYRNLVGQENFAIQGPRRERIWPDFVVKRNDNGHDVHDVLVLESKGAHLEGNPDTMYKRRVAEYFERVGKRVKWQQLGEDFRNHQFRFQILDEAGDTGHDWKDQLFELLDTD